MFGFFLFQCDERVFVSCVVSFSVQCWFEKCDCVGSRSVLLSLSSLGVVCAICQPSLLEPQWGVSWLWLLSWFWDGCGGLGVCRVSDLFFVLLFVTFCAHDGRHRSLFCTQACTNSNVRQRRLDHEWRIVRQVKSKCLCVFGAHHRSSSL